MNGAAGFAAPWLLAACLVILVTATRAPAGAQNKALQDCLCVCAIDPGRGFCGVTQSCFYNPEPNCGSTPGCADPNRGECINTIGCSVPCNRTPFNYAYGAPGDSAATTAARAQCREDCNDRFGGGTATPIATPIRTATRAATPTPTEPDEVGEISCGQTVTGTLSDGDLDLFGDGTFADLYFFTLYEPTIVEFTMSGSGFEEFVWIADVSNPDDYMPIFQGSPPQGGLLQPGEYVAVANNTYPIPFGSYSYSIHMACEGGAPSTPTRTVTRTASRTATITRTTTATATQTSTGPRTVTRTPTGTSTPIPRSPTRTATYPPEVDRIACGQQIAGVLDPSDEDYFGDDTWADLYDLHLPAHSDVTVRMEGADFLPYLLIFAAADPEHVIASNPRSLTVNLTAGDYVIVANNYDAVTPTTLPYTLSVDCEAEPTSMPTVTRTRSHTATPTPIPRNTVPRPTGTRTPTFTPLPTATNTHTATIAACPLGESTGELGEPAGPGCQDLVADAIEVVQTIQDLDNSVHLVAGKRTFVRFHVHSSSGNVRATARLTVGHYVDDPLAQVLAPVNPGASITVTEQPDRSLLDSAFLFELPDGFTEDRIVLEAEVNPNGAVPESDLSNNSRSHIDSFTDVLSLNLAVYRIGYETEGGLYYPAAFHVHRLIDWLRRVYPVAEVRYWLRSDLLPRREDIPEALPDCVSLNLYLTWARLLNQTFEDSQIPATAHYYGMVDDGGYIERGLPHMRGCSFGIEYDTVASGPTGDPAVYTGDPTDPTDIGYSWDKDGSFGDFYGGHELGHTWGRSHPAACKDFNPFSDYPHPKGRISPTLFGEQAIYGFDAGTRAIYGPEWKDFMSYCAYLWISDFNYHGLLDAFRYRDRAGSVAGQGGVVSDQLLVVGAIDADTGTVQMQPLFVIPAVEGAEPRTPGNHAIVLRDDAGRERARYAFTPAQIHDGPPAPGGPDPQPLNLVSFSELVPYAPGTARVDIEGPGVFHTIRAGMSTPAVQVTQPNGAELLDGMTIPVAWTAHDADGDPLTFAVQYSPDDGVTWTVVAQNVTANTVEVDTGNVSASERARFRVWVSDGIHTSSDISDGPSTVPNAPPAVDITAPADGTTVALGQTVAFQALAEDADTGSMTTDLVEWFSSTDGLLGSGSSLSVADLSTGTHTITCTANDGDGGVVTDRVTVVVVSDLSELPPVCAGDCDGDVAVSIDELIGGVAMALGTRTSDGCPAMDGDGDRQVSISELVAAVRAALEGCTPLAGSRQ